MSINETSLDNILKRVSELQSELAVDIKKISLSLCKPWFYDSTTGYIKNDKGSFFQIAGLKCGDIEQPVILQNEIGYLGIIRKRIAGEMMYLMQYKIEPGNINCIQISPTIQATKSNFTQQHGGKKPAYLDYFLQASKYKIVVDQIQSEQSSRFLGKRNRNIVIELPDKEEIEVLPSHEWMSMRQLKALMRYDNLVNMDTRTVLSCIPYYMDSEDDLAFIDIPLKVSMKYGSGKNYLPEIYHFINNYKMFDSVDRKIVPLSDLESWSFSSDKEEYSCNTAYSFKVIFCDIEIEGREVRHWCQPLFEATGIATFGLFTCVSDGVREFLVHAKHEVGCFDQIELGPSIQREFIMAEEKNAIDLLFDKMASERRGILFDVLLSEEGGRFFHEQNRNVIIEIADKNELVLPDGFFWIDFKTLNSLIQVNNTVNIQLRNLLSTMV